MLAVTSAAVRRVASSELRRLRPIPPPLLSFSTATSAPDSGNGNETAPRSRPPPIRVALTESAGRGVFATRAIGAGELIHTAKPLIAHPSQSLPYRVCSFCLKKLGQEKLLRSAHRRVTGPPVLAISAVRDAEMTPRGFMKLRGKQIGHCMTTIAGAASTDSLDILQPASLLPETIVEMEEEFELLKCTLMKAQIEDKLVSFLTKQWYIGVLARIRINAFRVELVGGSYEDLLTAAAASVAAEAAVGNAVYMLPSFYNHDCDPNAHIIWIENADARLKALRDIEADEELRICYIDASMDCEARQTLLTEGFGFQCYCLRCISGD